MEEETNSKEIEIELLSKLEKAISENNINNSEKLCSQLKLSIVETKGTLKDCHGKSEKPTKSSNLIILACKYNKGKILDYLFSDRKTQNNSFNFVKDAILPDNEDKMHHNAFYYAIRSGNIELLDKLIHKWPGNYFAVHLEEQDRILSRAYEELKFKNVPLSDEVQIYVESMLIDLRFFSYITPKCIIEQHHNVQKKLNNIKERIQLVVQNIFLLTENSNTNVDEKFLFSVMFIAQNIHVLKRHLKSTYDRIPWEEIEFCLVSFISSHKRKQEINMFIHAVLNKSRLLIHLENFAKRIKEENIETINLNIIAEVPNIQREKVVAGIISNCPEFEELYDDYQQIRDIYSLEKINDYVKLGLSANPNEKEEQIIIIRVLQVIGEYLKNSLESPKLANATSKLILLSLPKHTRKIIIDLRNSFSHAQLLSKRIEIEENTTTNFFIGLQNDTKKVGDVIASILYENKLKMIRILLNKFSNSENVNELKDIAKLFDNSALDEIVSGNFKMIELSKLEKILKELEDNITDMTKHEVELLNKMNHELSLAITKSKQIGTDYVFQFASFKGLSTILNDCKIDHNVVRGMKSWANKILRNMEPQIETCSLEKISDLSLNLLNSVKSRLCYNNLDKVKTLIFDFFYIAKFDISNIKWIEGLKEDLYKNVSYIPAYKKKNCKETKEKYNSLLNLKLSELKTIFNDKLNGQLLKKYLSYKSNKKLQAVIEMLILDIMSILGDSKCLENNLLFLDDSTPLLTGRCLRNHLAHDDAIINVLLSDPSLAVFLNAKKLMTENIMSKKKIGKLVIDNTSKLKFKYDQDLVSITNQERMFVALQEGNLEELKSCLEKGADINARTTNSWTSLHFAAKGPSLKIIKFIFHENSNIAKNDNGQTPLHIAAAYGRTDIVEFFITEAGVYVDSEDNLGKTSLHIAAQNGHKETVEILLNKKANSVLKTVSGYSPIHYAIHNNQIEVAKVLLKSDTHVDINEMIGGYTPLHVAAETGHLNIVHFLLQNNANANAKNDKEWTPLHAAALNGHLEVVMALILKGADVNAKVIDGCTPLHYAVETCNKNVVDVLLSHGANVNAVDKSNCEAPLHWAAKAGYEEICKTLLSNKANAHATTALMMTALHFAAHCGHLGIVSALIKHGVDINFRNKEHLTPLHLAVESGNLEIVEQLIKNNAEINVKAIDHNTPLFIAAWKGHNDILHLLITNKALVNSKNNQGKTALHVAAVNGSKAVMDLLIKNGADINARANDGSTPLHDAAGSGQRNAVTLLIHNKSEVNSRDNFGCTPLHAAIVGGHRDVVKILIKNKAEVNTVDVNLLRLAIEGGYKEIVQILIANGANVNAKGNYETPLFSAVKHNNVEILKILIANGANVNTENGSLLSLAVVANYRDIVDILLKNEACIKLKYEEDATLLHLAAKRGHKEIVVVLTTRGADVNANTVNNVTPLHMAAQEGFAEVSEILISHGADVNAKSNENTTPLHYAAVFGHSNVVKCLLANEANANVKDHKNRTPLELAVAHSHLQVVKIIFKSKDIDINAVGNDGWTILHIASQESDLEMVKYLLGKGSNANIRNASGSKPIHIAAREGCKDTVEFFINKGACINELGTINQTLLHYATMNGHLEVVKYLIAHGADINAKDDAGVSSMHIAAYCVYKNIIEILLTNGAVYNSLDKLNRKPLEMTNSKDIINLLSSTEKLFEAAKQNSPLEVVNCIKEGAFVNAKNIQCVTPLHYAAWKGYDDIVNVLLENKSDPNIHGTKGYTPLHYAAKFSHIKVVKTLLSNGAIYNAVSDSGKTPLDFTVEKSISFLFNMIGESFTNIENRNSKVIKDLNKIKDNKTIKAILNARNKENKTLIAAAVQNNFPKLEQLKQVSQENVSSKIKMGLVYSTQRNFQEALNIFNSVLDERKKILGPDNPATLDIKKYIAKVLYKQGTYLEALSMFEEIFQKQKEMFGLNEKDTLDTGSILALVLHRLGRDDEAFNIFCDICQRQKKVLGKNHSDTLDTQFHMALVLHRQRKYEEALEINRAVFRKRKELLGANYPSTIYAQNNIAMILASQDKNEEALKIYQEVLEKKKIVLGSNHADTLRTLHHIAGIIFTQRKYEEALIAYQELLGTQEIVLGLNHPDTLTTQYNKAAVLFAQGKWISALKTYKESFYKIKAVLGENHPFIHDILVKIEQIKLIFELENGDSSEILSHLQKDINIAASNGDIQTIQSLLKAGADVNDSDIDGIMPLHYAVSKGNIGVVNVLLKNGADVTKTTNKGNTPLHTAASQGHKDIVEVLLQHASHDKFNNFINAKTTLSGTTPLHVAVKNGFFEIVKCLLKYGTIYNLKNKKDETPSDLSSDKNITTFLKMLNKLFEDAKSGCNDIVGQLKTVKPNEFFPIMNARNNEGNTILQIVASKKHKYIAQELILLFKKNQTL